MVQIKVAASVLIASAAIAPALAYPLDVETRENNEVVGSAFSRRFARELNEELLEREPVFGVNHIKKWTGHGGHGGHRGHGKHAAAETPSTPTDASSEPPASAREYDEELLEREPVFGVNHIKKWTGHGGHGGHHGHSKHAAAETPSTPTDASSEPPASAREFDEDMDMFSRELELEELMEREPFLGFGHLKKWLGFGKKPVDPNAEAAPVAREYDDELFEREPVFGVNHIKKWTGHGGHGGHHSHGKHAAAEAASAPTDASSEPPASAREYDEELLEREPMFGVNHIKKWTGHGGHGGHHSHGKHAAAEAASASPDASSEAPASAREYDELLERYFDDLYEREMEAYDELLEREPMFGVNHIKKWTGHGGHGGHHGHGKHAAAEAASAPADASSEPPASAREYYDDLD